MVKYLSIDTECNGLNPFHGCLPYLITTCDKDYNQVYWQVPVDPLTRQCRFSSSDRKEIKEHLLEHDVWLMQNPVFDIAMLYAAGMKWIVNYWDRIRDTGIAAHLVNSSNKKKDLTALVLQYLNMDIQPYETAVKRATQQARNYCSRNLPEWRIAKEGDPMLPSGAGWKADMWLLPALADKLGHPEDHPWRKVGLDYALMDTATTLPLGLHLEKIIRQKKLWKIYEHRTKLLKINYTMQTKGITISGERTAELEEQYGRESRKLGKQCVAIAKSVGVDLVLPKTGNNSALLSVVFDADKFNLQPIAVSKKTKKPTLDKKVIETYLAELDPGTKPHRFLKCLSDKRSRDTACTYLKGYRRAWLPVEGNVEDWYVLHPSLNPVGTSTLRWSSSNPNEQNISKKEGFNLRYAFGPAPGREWWALDYSNLELVIPFYESGEKELIALFEDPDSPPYFGSYHLMIFSVLHPDKYDHDDPEGLLKAKKKYGSTWYQYTKNGNFALIYGAMEESGTADAAYRVLGAQSMIRSRFSKLDAHNCRMIDFANEHGYVETVPDKTIDPDRGYPIVCPTTKWGGVKPTLPLNYRTQSTAMQCTTKAMIRISDYFDELNKGHFGYNTLEILGNPVLSSNPEIGYFLNLQVHDEVVTDLPKDGKHNREVVKRTEELMRMSGDDIGIPLRVSVGYHPVNWSETVTL